MKLSPESFDLLKSLKNEKISVGELTPLNFELKMKGEGFEFTTSFARRFLGASFKAERRFAIDNDGEISFVENRSLQDLDNNQQDLSEYEVTDNARQYLEKSLELFNRAQKGQEINQEAVVEMMEDVSKGLGGPKKLGAAVASASASRLGDSRKVTLYHAKKGELAIKFDDSDQASSFASQFSQMPMKIYDDNKNTVFIDLAKGRGTSGVYKSENEELAVAFDTQQTKDLFLASLSGLADSKIETQTDNTIYFKKNDLPYEAGNRDKSIKLELPPSYQVLQEGSGR